MKLSEILNEAIKIGSVDTETGIATLFSDGTMLVNNSGYKQHLTVQQVDAAWSGAKKLPHKPEDIIDMKADGADDAEMAKYQPAFDGEYWDFGDEQHVIPSQEEFK